MDLEKFLQDIGLESDQIELLKKDEEERPEDFDYKDLLDTYKNSQEAVYKKKLKPTIDDMVNEAVKNRMTNFKKTFSRQLSDKFELEDIEVDEENLNEFIDEFKSTIDEKIKSATQSDDDELLAKLNNYKERVTELKKQNSTWQEKYDEDIKKARKEAEEKIRSFEREKLFRKYFSKIKWGVPEEHVPVWEDRLKNEILSNYQVDTDGTLLDKDGKSKAVNFSDTGVYTSVDEPLEYLVNKYKLTKKNNNDEQGGSGGGGGRRPVVTDDAGDATKKMKKRMEEQARKKQTRGY